MLDYLQKALFLWFILKLNQHHHGFRDKITVFLSVKCCIFTLHTKVDKRGNKYAKICQICSYTQLERDEISLKNLMIFEAPTNTPQIPRKLSHSTLCWTTVKHACIQHCFWIFYTLTAFPHWTNDVKLYNEINKITHVKFFTFEGMVQCLRTKLCKKRNYP